MINKEISEKSTVFATGVFLQPVKIKINDIEQWRWVAVGFEDESYFNGKSVNPIEYSNKLENMLQTFDE